MLILSDHDLADNYMAVSYNSLSHESLKASTVKKELGLSGWMYDDKEIVSVRGREHHPLLALLHLIKRDYNDSRTAIWYDMLASDVYHNGEQLLGLQGSYYDYKAIYSKAEVTLVPLCDHDLTRLLRLVTTAKTVKHNVNLTNNVCINWKEIDQAINKYVKEEVLDSDYNNSYWRGSWTSFEQGNSNNLWYIRPDVVDPDSDVGYEVILDTSELLEMFRLLRLTLYRASNTLPQGVWKIEMKQWLDRLAEFMTYKQAYSYVNGLNIVEVQSLEDIQYETLTGFIRFSSDLEHPYRGALESLLPKTKELLQGDDEDLKSYFSRLELLMTELLESRSTYFAKSAGYVDTDYSVKNNGWRGNKVNSYYFDWDQGYRITPIPCTALYFTIKANFFGDDESAFQVTENGLEVDIISVQRFEHFQEYAKPQHQHAGMALGLELRESALPYKKIAWFERNTFLQYQSRNLIATALVTPSFVILVEIGGGSNWLHNHDYIIISISKQQDYRDLQLNTITHVIPG